MYKKKAADGAEYLKDTANAAYDAASPSVAETADYVQKKSSRSL